MTTNKTAEQAADKYCEENVSNVALWSIDEIRELFITAYTAAPKPPVWRKIVEGGEYSEPIIAIKADGTDQRFHGIGGRALIAMGYTHYLPVSELLNFEREQ